MNKDLIKCMESFNLLGGKWERTCVEAYTLEHAAHYRHHTSALLMAYKYIKSFFLTLPRNHGRVMWWQEWIKLSLAVIHSLHYCWK